MLSRRSFFAGLSAAFAAPAIVRASSLMPIKAMRWLDGIGEIDVSHQAGSIITVSLNGSLQVGDVITIAGVRMFSRLFRRTAGPRQFVVTRLAEASHRCLSIYPPIIDDADPRYQTVDALPMRGAAIELVSPAA